MAGYERSTAMQPEQVLDLAEEHLPAFIGLRRSRRSERGATYTGDEGTVDIALHAHGGYTDVVARTDQLRTSRMDYEIQRFLSRLPYQYEDRGGTMGGAVR